jgi:3-deoxy-D-manno-octulosonic-acid transferase
VPVLVGPQHRNSRDALALIAGGGAAVFTDERSAVATITRWLRNEDVRGAAGADARAVVQAGLGAAERSTSLVISLLG